MASSFSSRTLSASRNARRGSLTPLCFMVALFLPVVASANPGTYVWWELESSNVQYTGLDQGSGRALQFWVSDNLPLYQFQFVMKMANDQTSTNGLSAYRTNLWRGTPVAGNSLGRMTNDPLTGELNPLYWSGAAGFQSGSVNANESLIINYGRSGAGSDAKLNALNSPQAFIRLNLTIDVSGAEMQKCSVWQTVGAGLFRTQPPSPNQVCFGPNPAVNGSVAVSTWPEAALTLPVITVHGIPEPATLALFGVGLLVLVRRRG
jgi:hypothetical protein